jgi:xylulokinase
VWSSVEQACRATIKVTKKIQPNKKSAAFYDRYYATYHKLYGDLRDRFPEMAAIAG